MVGGFHIRLDDASACATALDGRHEQETEFLDSNTLRIHSRKASETLADLETVTVRQISAKNDRLSETEEYIIPHPEEDTRPRSPGKNLFLSPLLIND